jgi:DNA-binding response OmpR family regulator
MQKRKVKIFIVHPHAELCRAYKTRLEMEGFTVIIFSDHDEALSHIAHGQPNLIIVGEQLGPVNAEQFRELLDDPQIGQGIPTMVLADGSYSDYKNGLENNYIPKTAAFSAAVIAKINELLGLTTSRR